METGELEAETPLLGRIPSDLGFSPESIMGEFDGREAGKVLDVVPEIPTAEVGHSDDRSGQYFQMQLFVRVIRAVCLQGLGREDQGEKEWQKEFVFHVLDF